MFRRSHVAVPRNTTCLAKRLAQTFTRANLLRAARGMGPTLVALTFVGAANVAHAQGTMDFSGAQTLMGTFNMCPPTVQSKIEFLNLLQVVTEDSMCAVEGQREDIRNLQNGVKRGMIFEAE